jgi:hypothetical protein
MGIPAATRNIPRFENQAATALVGIVWVIGAILGYALLGILIGGGLGFGIDMLVFR